MKKAVITLQLIEEAQTTSNEALEREIFEELSEELPRIPWQGKIIQVRVTEN